MPPDQQQRQQAPLVQVPGQAPVVTAPTFQGPAFGGTEFFPIPTGGEPLLKKEAYTYNEAQQERFKRRRVPQVSYR